ncbi:meiosis-specific nuclear structural protein 1-like [Anopheles moucheti]|uniref:meiosis-specific nuclear structural protein 1-like n=1 Tax=Anopheles moucheti TaxID=186751 RepID=UPI0022F0C475|nr:meiosis-specific nuclear structural protein 1-like [Anopheles moucheti]
MHPSRQKQQQLKQNALCKAVESNRMNANYQKDFDQIQHNCLEHWKKKSAEQSNRGRKIEEQQIAVKREAERRTMLLEEQKKTQQIQEATRLKINEEKLRQQLRESNQEMRLLECKLRAAYVAKGLAAQIAEAELRKKHERLQALKEKEEFDKLKHENAEYMKQKQAIEENEKRRLRSVLQAQMGDTRLVKNCLYEEFLNEKIYLDAVVKKIQDEHLEAIQRKLEQQKCTRQEMEYFQEAKQTWKARQAFLEEEENERIKKYGYEKDLLKQMKQTEKQKSDRKREELNRIMIASLEKDITDQRNREDMLQELYIAERNEKEETKRQSELEDQIRKRIAIRLDLEKQLVENNCQRELQTEEEKRFQQQQIEMWAERDRIDMMSNEKRRRKMMEYRRNVQELMEDRRKRRMEDVKSSMEQEERQKQEELRNQEILEEERIKLLKEHATALLGFFPPGVLRETDREFIPLPKINNTTK